VLANGRWDLIRCLKDESSKRTKLGLICNRMRVEFSEFFLHFLNKRHAKSHHVDEYKDIQFDFF
jgi:hypothetical protein